MAEERNELSYRSSHQAAGYAAFYDQTILEGYAGELWRRWERPILESFLAAADVPANGLVVDFACGTGRITQVVSQHFPRAVGVDVSGEMLNHAKERCPGVRFLRQDLTEGVPPELRDVSLVTAFRFFQNAEPLLRKDVLQVFAEIVRPGATLILNVQCNAAGPAGVVQRLRRRYLGAAHLSVMSLDEVRALLQFAGFAIEEVEWYGFWPRTGRYFPGLARMMQSPANRVVRRLGLPQHRLAQMFMVRASAVG
jgi:SAM-dependent methyltransferase